VPTLTQPERARGGLLGLAVADALGAPLEFAAPARAATAVEAGLEMTGGGSFGWLPGEWTDDTTMALCLAESIGAHGLLDLDDVTRRYADWASSGPKDIGNATSAALRGASSAAEAREQARTYVERTGSGAGNGTIMRAAPIGLAASSLAEAVDAARADAVLTHGDARAGHASAALCGALLSLDEPLPAARAECAGEPKLLEALDADAAELAALAANQTGACWTALGVAMHALTEIDDYERGVLWAISLGGDTDTNAAVAGALLGARHGVEAIPKRWLDVLRRRDRIEAAAASLVAIR